mmetsp:Transcript_112616/g.318115  ORF Transcript_112616/g.318115 Transcript_112616/m.318115 type:complete len:93 (-) Transcript_112616:895-1173(-)
MRSAMSYERQWVQYGDFFAEKQNTSAAAVLLLMMVWLMRSSRPLLARQCLKRLGCCRRLLPQVIGLVRGVHYIIQNQQEHVLLARPPDHAVL